VAREVLVDLAAGRPVSIQSPVDPRLVAAAQRHGLVPLLARAVSDPLVMGLAGRIQARTRSMMEQLGEVVEDANARGIRVSVLKGPFLAHHVYRESGIRGFSDLDLLVPPDQVEPMLDLLGSRPHASIPPKKPMADKREVLMGSPGGIRFAVDLHWDLFSYTQLRGAARGATDEAWSAATPIEDGPLAGTWRLPDGASTAFLCCHAVLDHRFRLILFRDLAELAETVAWEPVIEFATRWRLRSPTYLALLIAREILEAPVPDEVMNALRVASIPVAYLETAIPRLDITDFDGRRLHPVNLAFVLAHDRRLDRLALAARAPWAVFGWRRRVASDPRRPLRDPRVLMVVSSDRRRGAEVASTRVAAELNRQGVPVDVVSLTRSTEGPTVEVETLTDVPPGSLRRSDLGILRVLRRRIRGYDVVVAYGGTLRPVVLAALGTGVPVVHRSIGEPDFWVAGRLRRGLQRWLLNRTRMVLAVSQATAAQVRALAPGVEVRVLPDGVPTGERVEGVGPPWRDELRVLFVGSLSGEKGPLEAVAAVTGVEGATLRMVGEGPLRTEVERAAGDGTRVELVGAVEDPAPHYRWADVLLLTSRTEGLPGVVLEAAAVGTPAVAFDVGGVSEAVGPGGEVVPPGDIDAIRRSLQSLVADPGKLERLGRAAAEHVRRRFRLEDTAASFARVLREVARR
jgi:glycosyltransferase involved in cell wall biosynthesis